MEYKTKLLIADESPVWRAQVREGLMRAGYRNIEEAVNGEEALLKISAYRPDVVLIDVWLSKLDGIGVLRGSHSLDAEFHRCGADPSVNRCHRVALTVGQGYMGTAVEGIGMGLAVQLQQIPVKLRFHLQVSEFSICGSFLNQGVADTIQTVMGKKTIQVCLTGFCRFQPQTAANHGEKIPAGHSVKLFAQLIHGIIHEDIVIEK